MRSQQKLTARTILHLSEPGRYADGGGLYLQITPGGSKSWLFRFMRVGKARAMGLGPVDIISLADARERARSARRLLLDGTDPIEARDNKRAADRLDAARSITFRECAEKFIAAHEAGWRNAKHRGQWANSLATYAYPVIGEISVASVDTTLVVKIIEPLWKVKPETAARVRGRIESILDWAKVREFRSGENPARWKGHFDKLLPPRSLVARVKHHPALPYSDMPDFMSELRALESVSARALEFTVLTAARTGAVIGAVWSEIDFTNKTWAVPAERSGAKIVGSDPKPRRIPLSDRALAILEGLQRADDVSYVFAGRNGQPLSNMAMLELMRRIRPGYVPHGCRSSFKDWCSETTGYPNEVSEAALWHVVADKVEAAYRRGELFEKRRRLMTEWARYCASPVVVQRTVVAIRS